MHAYQWRPLVHGPVPVADEALPAQYEPGWHKPLGVEAPAAQYCPAGHDCRSVALPAQKYDAGHTVPLGDDEPAGQ